MNEILFFIHILFVVAFLLGSLRIGKEALMTFVVMQSIIANLFVVKQMILFQKDVTCADVYIVGSILGMNLLQEYFGRDTAKKTMWISFFCMIFFTVISRLHVSYAPNSFDTSQNAFMTILSQTPRIFLASLATFFIVQRFDIMFFTFLKKIFKDKYLTLRVFLSMIVSQLMDTIFFSYAGLYGIVPSMMDIVLVSFVIKVVIILALTPFTKLSRRLVV